jgi:nitroreductase
MKALIKKLLAGDKTIQHVYTWYQNSKETLQYTVLYPILLKIPFAQNFYFLFSQSFAHEIKMFVAARRDYLKTKHRKTENYFLLRRNIHRLEKGLLIKNRRSVFALDYIEETVLLLKNLYSNNEKNIQIQWAVDILTQYFEVTGKAPQITNAKKLFNAIIKNESSKNKHFIPYILRVEDTQTDFASMFQSLAKKRKSVRYFKPNQIPERAKMDIAVEIAGLAPSSCNRQPFEFRIIDDAELVNKVVSLPGGTKGFAENIVAIVAVIGQMNVSPSIGDRHLMYVDGSLAAMNFMLALESMGIASCPLNWPEDKKKDDAIKKILLLKDFERPIMMIAYGYADEQGMLACSVRKPINQLRKYN